MLLRSSSTMLLVATATLLSSSLPTVTGQQQQQQQQITVPGEVTVVVPPVPYQILPLSVKMTVSDRGFEMESFQSRFEGIMALHLTNHFFQSLPTEATATAAVDEEPFVKSRFDKVELRTRLAQTYTGAPDGESRIEAAISGAAYFHFADAADAPAGNATYTRQVMTTTTLEAFQGAEYLKMLDLYMEDDILRLVTGMEISVENTLIAGGGFYDPGSQRGGGGSGSSSHPNTAAIAVSVVCLGLAAVGVVLFYLVQKKKRKQQSGKSLRIGEGDPQSPEQSQAQDGGAEYGAGTGAGAGAASDSAGYNSSDVWMDEWTQKITSIPLRLAGKTVKAKSHSHSRPATRQSRKVWLFCK
jgi:hypothetical protein